MFNFDKNFNMKKVAFTTLICIISLYCSNVYAKGGEPFTQAMKAAVGTLDTTRTAKGFQELANQFERIGTVESKEWLPAYYAAYCYTMTVFTSRNSKVVDDYMDKAEVLINHADSLKPNNSEIMTVKGLINSGRIMKDPASRGRKYGTIAGEFYEKAKKLDETNPRPYTLQGQGAFYTPKMFGGGKEKAKPLLEAAVARYKTFKPESEIAPHWGEQFAVEMLKQCQ
jgi:hypothetical protein